MSDFEKLCDILGVEPEEREDFLRALINKDEHLVIDWTPDGNIQGWGTV